MTLRNFQNCVGWSTSSTWNSIKMCLSHFIIWKSLAGTRRQCHWSQPGSRPLQLLWYQTL